MEALLILRKSPQGGLVAFANEVVENVGLGDILTSKREEGVEGREKMELDSPLMLVSYMSSFIINETISITTDVGARIVASSSMVE